MYDSAFKFWDFGFNLTLPYSKNKNALMAFKPLCLYKAFEFVT